MISLGHADYFKEIVAFRHQISLI